VAAMVVAFVVAAFVGYELSVAYRAPASITTVYHTVPRTVTRTLVTTITRTTFVTTTVSSSLTSTSSAQATSTVSSATPTVSSVTKSTSYTLAPIPSYASGARIEFASISSVSLQRLEEVVRLAASTPSSFTSLMYALAGFRAATTVATVTPATVATVALAGKASIAHSTTNVQVSGIDELDVVKTNGRALFYSKNTNIYIVNATSLSLAYTLKVPRYVRGIYVWNNELIAICGGAPIRILWLSYYPPMYIPNSIQILVYNVTNIRSPKLIANITMSGYYLSSRLYNGVLYVLAQSPAFINRRLVMPVVGNAVAKPSNIEVLTPGDTYLTVLALNLSSLRGRAYAYLINRASIVYMSKDHLVVVSNLFGVYRVVPQLIERYASQLPKDLSKKLSELISKGKFMEAYYELLSWASRSYGRVESLVKTLEAMVGREGAYARVFVFSINGLSIAKDGYVDVPGVVTRQFAVNQLGKYLVVATVRYSIVFSVYKIPIITPPGATRIPVTIYKQVGETTTTRVSYITITHSRTPTSPRYYIYPRFSVSSVGVYVVDLSTMRIAASIPKVISNEYVFGARLVGTTLFLVTNRVVDPLFAIDLSNPTKPKVVGYVKLPGYLTYLHPISRGLLLGIGMEKGSLKIELFNVTNLKRIREVSKLVISRGWTPALYDYHAITFWSSRKILMFPISVSWRSVGIAVVSYADNEVSLVKILEAPNAIRAVWIGEKVFAVSPNEIKVFSAVSWRPIAEIKL